MLKVSVIEELKIPRAEQKIKSCKVRNFEQKVISKKVKSNVLSPLEISFYLGL